MTTSVHAHTWVTPFSLLAVLLLAVAVSLFGLVPAFRPVSRVLAAGSVSVSMVPATQTVNPNVTFDVTVQVNPSGGAVAAADVYVNFDPTYLSVVEIVDGPSGGLNVFVKNYSNAAGTIDIGAGTLGSPVTTSFTLVTLRLQGKVGTGALPAQLVFATAGNRTTVVKDELDQNILGTLNNGQVTITGPTITPVPGTNTPTPTRTNTPIPGRDARIAIDPASVTKDPGNTFDLNVRIDPQGAAIAAADVYLNFDPAYLTVSEIIDGTALTVFVKNYDNMTGRIDIGAGTLSTPITTAFNVVTLRLLAHGGTGTTPASLAFNFSGDRVTVVKNEADTDLLGLYTNGSISISGPTPTRQYTPTNTATATPTATRTNTPTPTASPTPSGTPIQIWFQNEVSPSSLYLGCEDTYLSLDTPNIADYANTALKVKNDGGGGMRPLLRFDLTQIPVGSQIVTATLHLNQSDYKKNNNFDSVVAAYKVLRPWVLTEASWNKASTSNSWAAPGASAATDRSLVAESSIPVTRLTVGNTMWRLWNVGSMVQDWVNNPTANYGVLLIGSGETQEFRFNSSQVPYTSRSLRPKLEVHYRLPLPTPTPTNTATPTATPTNTPQPGNIDGMVWNDLNGNGIMEGGEPGVPGASVAVYAQGHLPPEAPVVAPVTTGSDGAFHFGNLVAGWYVVIETNPATFYSTTQDTLNVLVLAGSTAQANFGAWVPEYTPTPTRTLTPTQTLTPTRTLTPTATPTGTIVRPYKAYMPVIIKH